MFTPETFRFLRELRADNTREWFEANRARWEAHGKQPLQAFIREFRPLLAEIAPRFVADDKSVFRINRDIRFSKDKSPYKTHIAAQFRHELVKGPAGEVVHAPGFYLHIAPDGPGEMEGVFGGFGMWQPEGQALAAIRGRMMKDPAAWLAAKGTLVLGGSSLKKVPTGIAPDHPLAEDLRRKDFMTIVELSEADAVSPDFAERYAAACRQALPLQRWLCAAVGLPY